jgi:hypothetical protein
MERLSVRWEMHGKVYLCTAVDRQTANQVQQAIAAFWSGEEVSVQIWSGLDMVKELVS